MLAGLQSQVETMFPALKGLTPDAGTLQDGLDKLKANRVVRVSAYKVKVFDMHRKAEREDYTKTMLELTQKLQIGTARVLVNQRETMHRADGTTGWFGYLEWMEYEFKDGVTGTKHPPHRPKKEARHG